MPGRGGSHASTRQTEERCVEATHSARCVFGWRRASTPSSCMPVCVCVRRTGRAGRQDSNMAACVGDAVIFLRPRETKHAHAERLSHGAGSQLVAPVPSVFPLLTVGAAQMSP